jgi:hypothetical protein
MMSKKKELEKSNDNTIKAIEGCIGQIANLADYVPILHERKMEAEANRLLLQSADNIEIDEVYSKLSLIQASDEKSFTLLSTGLAEATHILKNAVCSTSGTASVYQEFAYKLSPAISSPAFVAYKTLADYKSHKEEIPRNLNRLHDGLGDMFLHVHNVVYKAKNKVATVKQAVSDMRDVLNQVWANLANLAEKNHPEKWRGITNITTQS